MRRRSLLWLWALPLLPVGGCLLPSFDNVAASPGAGGVASGGEPNVAAGAGGEAPTGGAPAGGVGGSSGGDGAIEAVADQYILQQGKSLHVNAADGVLSNDTPSDLVVSAFDDTDKARPKALDAKLDIAADGSLDFKPAAAFFGRYVAEYTSENAAGVSASASVTFVVQPASVDLGLVEQGIGGVLLEGSDSDGAGTALAALGDVNDDGFDDFAVGAPGALSGSGSIYVVFGRADFAALTLGPLTPSSKEQRFAVLAGDPEAKVGQYVSTAGNFDADDVPDILLGAPSATSDKGALFVVFGGAELRQSLPLLGLAKASGLELSGDPAGQQLGLHVAGGGDLNGDGQADLLAGLYPDPVLSPTTGGVCLLSENPGKSGALTDTQAAAMTDSGVFKLPQSLAIVGDVNGDGNDDWLATSTRNVALVFGQSDSSLPTSIDKVQSGGFGLLRQRKSGVTGVVAVAAAGDVNGDRHADFAYCDEFAAGVSCQVFFGPIKASASLEAGPWSVTGFDASLEAPRLSPGADLNDDGFADLLLADDAGAYVVFGREAGFGAVDVGSLGSNGFSLSAPKPGGLSAVATVGDVNGDGYQDFAIGEPAAASGAGHVYVVLGGPFSADQR